MRGQSARIVRVCHFPGADGAALPFRLVAIYGALTGITALTALLLGIVLAG
jgi:hypothetical protein